MYNRETKIQVDLPSGFELFFCELRGYDSPDRWHELRLHGETVGSFERGEKGQEKARQLAARIVEVWSADQTFMSKVLQEELSSDQLVHLFNEEVGRWHRTSVPLAVHRWLGMTLQEYRTLAQGSLEELVKARRGSI